MLSMLLSVALNAVPAPTAVTGPCTWPNRCVAQVQTCQWPNRCAEPQVQTCQWPNRCAQG